MLSHVQPLQPYGLRPTRLLCPWDSPGKNTGVGCHALLQGDLPHPGIEPASLMSPALAGGFFTTSTTWEAPNLQNRGQQTIPNRPNSARHLSLYNQQTKKLFTFFIIVVYLFTCLASPGVSCSTWGLPSSFQHVGSSTPACAIF